MKTRFTLLLLLLGFNFGSLSGRQVLFLRYADRISPSQSRVIFLAIFYPTA